MAGKAKKNAQELILEVLEKKASTKQDIYALLRSQFAVLKEVVQEIANDLEERMKATDPRVSILFRDKGEMSCDLKVAGDTIIFHMHSNVFRLDQSHSLWKGTYLEEDETRGYFGIVNMYNFLSDSFKYNRERDLGYLVARLFLNKEDHFFLQGKRQLGFLYNDLPDSKLDRVQMRNIVESVILHVLNFDLLVPPYEQTNQVTVMEINELNANVKISTGKRLGFRFQTEGEDIE